MEQTRQPEPEDEGDIGQTIQRVVRIVQKGRWWILSFALATVVVAVVGLSFVPNEYKSDATILIDEQQVSQRLVNPLSTDTVAQRLQAMTQEILSRPRLLEIIREFDLFSSRKKLPPDARVELMRKAITIEPIGEKTRDGSFDAFSISFTGETPELAQAVTQKLSLLFIERNSASQVQRANATTNFLKEPLEEKRKRAAEMTRQIQAFKMQYGSDLPEGRVVNDTRLAEARIQLQTTITSLNRAKEQQIIWESMLSGILTRLKSERTTLLIRFTPKHPEVLKKDEEIAQVEALVGNSKSGLPAGSNSGHLASSDPAVAQLSGQIQASRLEIDTLAKDEKRLAAAVADLQGHLSMVPVRDQELADMVRQSAALNDEITGLEKLQQQSGLSADMERNQQGQQFRQLDAASLPVRPSSPKRLPVALGAMAGGVVLGFLAAFLLEMLSPAYHTEQELRERFGPPLVLSVPLLPTRGEKRAHRVRMGFEWIAASIVTVATFAVEFYVYRHP